MTYEKNKANIVRSIIINTKFDKQIMEWNPFVYLSFIQNNFWYNSRTTQGTKIKLRFVLHFFLRNIIRSKQHPSISSAHAQLSHTETWSDFSDQLIDILKRLLWFFLNFVSLTKKKLISYVTFLFLLTSP